jgi:uncharacterized protein YqkB
MIPLLPLIISLIALIAAYNLTFQEFTKMLHEVAGALTALLFSLSVIAQNSTNTSSSDLKFGPVSFEGYQNYVVRDNVTSAQIVVSA